MYCMLWLLPQIWAWLCSCETLCQCWQKGYPLTQSPWTKTWVFLPIFEETYCFAHIKVEEVPQAHGLCTGGASSCIRRQTVMCVCVQQLKLTNGESGSHCSHNNKDVGRKIVVVVSHHQIPCPRANLWERTHNCIIPSVLNILAVLIIVTQLTFLTGTLAIFERCSANWENVARELSLCVCSSSIRTVSGIALPTTRELSFNCPGENTHTAMVYI